MTNKTIITVVAIGAVLVLCAVAMFKGIDGAVYMTCLAIIGGLAGYGVKAAKNKINSQQ